MGTLITHIKAGAAKFGLGLVFRGAWQAHRWKTQHASGSIQNLPSVINAGNPSLYSH